MYRWTSEECQREIPPASQSAQGSLGVVIQTELFNRLRKLVSMN